MCNSIPSILGNAFLLVGKVLHTLADIGMPEGAAEHVPRFWASKVFISIVVISASR